MRLHVLGMPHTETTREFEHCAFTARTRVFAAAMQRAGHDVFLYAGKRNEAVVGEHVALTDRGEQAAWWPWYDGRQVFNDFDPQGQPWRTWNGRAMAAIAKRADAGDILCLTMGTSHRPIAEALPDLVAVETGIGYSGVWAPFRVYETAAWRAFLAAREPSDTVRFYDTVIPRAWDLDDFPGGAGDGGYFAFVGRLIERKGPHIAAEACKRLGVKLVVAGQGARSWSRSEVVCDDGTKLEGDVEYAGVVGPQERAKLMGGAMAVFAPTMYFEPLGGVAIEAMLTGTPAITTDYGGFVDTVAHGTNGFRCSTLADFVAAGESAPRLDRATIRAEARCRYGSDAVASQFGRYFERLDGLRGEGWYAA